MSKPRGEGDLADQLAAIESALASSKVDSHMSAQFAQLRAQPDFDPDKFNAAFLAKVKSADIQFDGPYVLSAIGTILAMLAPYSALPKIVANPDVINLEASRPAGLQE